MGDFAQPEVAVGRRALVRVRDSGSSRVLSWQSECLLQASKQPRGFRPLLVRCGGEVNTPLWSASRPCRKFIDVRGL